MERKITNAENQIVKQNIFALFMILFSNICLYSEENVRLYIVFSGLGIVITFISNIKNLSFRIYKKSVVIWLVIVYAMYFFYGTFFLRSGIFNWDAILFRLLECTALYLSFSAITKNDYHRISFAFAISGLASLVFLIYREKGNLLAGGIRIGESLSGNVNTAGYSFGIISMLLMWSYCMHKSRKTLLLVMIFIIFSLLTGSKKVLIFIVFDLFLVVIYEKNKVNAWLKITFVALIGIYAVLNISYLYNIIGNRIEAMILTLLKGNSTASYSYSTDMRELMIKEGTRFFLNHPIFGGGYNYFALLTSTNYEYSHCNYIELLCSFGFVGTMIYYSKYLNNLQDIIFINKYDHSEETKNKIYISLVLIMAALFLDWAAVTFPAQSLWYIPIIFSSVLLEQIYKSERVQNREENQVV